MSVKDGDKVFLPKCRGTKVILGNKHSFSFRDGAILGKHVIEIVVSHGASHSAEVLVFYPVNTFHASLYNKRVISRLMAKTNQTNRKPS